MKLKYYLRGLGIGIIITAIIMSFTRQPEKLTDAQIKLRAHELGMVEKNVLADYQEEENIVLEKEDNPKDISSQEMVSLEENSKENEEEKDITTENAESTKEEVVVNSEEMEETKENQKEMAENPKETTEAIIESQPTKEETQGNVTIVGSFSESIVPTEKVPEIVEMKESGNESTLNDTKVENSNETSDNSVQNEVVENYVVVFVESGYSSEYASKKVLEAGLVDSWLEFNRYLVRNGLDRKIRAGNHEIPVGAGMEEIARILCRQE